MKKHHCTFSHVKPLLNGHTIYTCMYHFRISQTCNQWASLYLVIHLPVLPSTDPHQEELWQAMKGSSGHWSEAATVPDPWLKINIQIISKLENGKYNYSSLMTKVYQLYCVVTHQFISFELLCVAHGCL